MMQLYIPVALSSVRCNQNTSHDDFVMGPEVVVNLFPANHTKYGNVTYITQMYSKTCVLINVFLYEYYYQ